MSLERRWVYFDLEGTGTDPQTDRIVEMCFVELPREGCTLRKHFEARVNPGRPIPAEATAVHGITDDDVRGAEPFSTYAAEVQEIIEGAVLCGYSIRGYDTLLLDRELRMARQPGVEKDALGRIVQAEVDLYGLWQRLEPRNLATAAKRFAGVELENAHSAAADTEVLPGILRGMLTGFDLPDDVERLCELSKREGAVDRDGKFVKRDDGVVVFGFSQSRGQPVGENPGLLRWMLQRDFSAETKWWAEQFLKEAMDYVDEDEW